MSVTVQVAVKSFGIVKTYSSHSPLNPAMDNLEAVRTATTKTPTPSKVKASVLNSLAIVKRILAKSGKIPKCAGQKEILCDWYHVDTGMI
jgi:hypothetical protein